jgi:hypothetical protein
VTSSRWVTYQDETMLLDAISQDAAMLCAGLQYFVLLIHLSNVMF